MAKLQTVFLRSLNICDCVVPRKGCSIRTFMYVHTSTHTHTPIQTTALYRKKFLTASSTDQICLHLKRLINLLIQLSVVFRIKAVLPSLQKALLLKHQKNYSLRSNYSLPMRKQKNRTKLLG